MRAHSARFACTLLVGAGLSSAIVGCNDPPKALAVSAADASAPSASVASSQAFVDAGPAAAIPVPAATVLSIVNPDGAPAYTGPTGSVEGIITYVGDPPLDRPTHADATKCPRAEAVYGKEFRLGDTTTRGSELLDAIVAVTGYRDFYVPETKESVPVEIEGCAISPRTILATFGQRLEARNKGPELIAPAIDQGVNAALMVAVPHAPEPVYLYPRKVGRFVLTERLGKTFMHNDVYVLPNPLHAVTDAHGHYRIDGVPVGKLTVNATHPTFTSEASAPVEVVANVVVSADLVLTRKSSSSAPATSGSAAPRPPR